MSPFIDDRGRLFGRVSVVDIIVVLLIVAVGAFAWGRFAGDQAKMKDYRMVVLQSRGRAIPQVTDSNVGEQGARRCGAVLGRIRKVATPESRTPTDVPRLWAREPGGTVQRSITTSASPSRGTGRCRAVSMNDRHGRRTVLRAGKPLVLVGPGASLLRLKTVIVRRIAK